MNYNIIFPDGTNLEMDTKTPLFTGTELSLLAPQPWSDSDIDKKATHLYEKIFRVTRLRQAIYETRGGTTFDAAYPTAYLEEIPE